MGVFSAFFKRRLAPLVTCIVQRIDGSWQVTWVSDGRVPGEFSAWTLSSATDQAATEVARLYAGQVEETNAELQFAIYPWGGGGGREMLDVTLGADGFVARGIQGTDVVISASTVDELVTSAEGALPDTSEAMFRWIRKVSTLA